MSRPSRQRGIVVGVDRSAGSKMAVQWAARNAELRNVPLTLVQRKAASEASSKSIAKCLARQPFRLSSSCPKAPIWWWWAASVPARCGAATWVR